MGGCQRVTFANCLNEDIQSGFPHGDNAFDAVIGRFGKVKVWLGQRGPGKPDGRAIREIEEGILGRESLRSREGGSQSCVWPLRADRSGLPALLCAVAVIARADIQSQ